MSDYDSDSDDNDVGDFGHFANLIFGGFPGYELMDHFQFALLHGMGGSDLARRRYLQWEEVGMPDSALLEYRPTALAAGTDSVTGGSWDRVEKQELKLTPFGPLALEDSPGWLEDTNDTRTVCTHQVGGHRRCF